MKIEIKTTFNIDVDNICDNVIETIETGICEETGISELCSSPCSGILYKEVLDKVIERLKNEREFAIF